MTADLLADLRVREVDQDELLDLLARYFGSGRYDARGSVRYPRQGAVAIQVRSSRSGEIERLDPGPALTADRVADLRQRVESTLLLSNGIAAVTVAMLTARRVEGTYDSPGGEFRFGPVPGHAPRSVGATDQPFVFEARVPGSADPIVTRYRASREAQRWAWVLNALLIDGVRIAPSGTRQEWVLVVPDGQVPSESCIHLAQNMYWFRGLSAPDYSLPAGPPLPRIEHAIYYSRAGLDDTPLDIPSSLDTSIASYLGLSGDRRKRFLRAAQWFSTSQELWDIQHSSAFVALVAAIETLAGEPEAALSRCPTCNRETVGPTERFRNYLVDLGLDRSTASRLYSMRSKLVHGMGTLLEDEPLALTFKSPLIEERQSMRHMHAAVRAALVSWLTASSTPAT